MNETEWRRSALLPALLAASTLAGLSACGGTSSTSDGSPRTPATATPTAHGVTSSPRGTPRASARAVKAEKPVPVEDNPPGDIPDNLAFIPFTSKPGHYSFTHPEGWARTSHGVRVRFTDKLNGVTAESLAATRAPTVSSAQTRDVPRLRASVPAFRLREITAVTLPAGRGVHIVFRRNSDPNPVTGKVYRDEVEEYAVFSRGRLVRMDLYGPVGADNVDAYRTMSQSLTIR